MASARVGMRMHIGSRLDQRELAAVCGTSARSLQRGFVSFTGYAPLAYLRQLRLQLAYGDFANPHNVESVAQIAAKYGYSHMGRFAADYRRFFDQRPSDTMRLARSERAEQLEP